MARAFTPVYPKGSEIVCRNGHPIYRTTIDLDAWDVLGADVLESADPRISDPVEGDLIECPECGVRGFGRVRRPGE